jgi:hypothetical protein
MLAALERRRDPVVVNWSRCFCLSLWRVLMLARADAQVRLRIAAQNEWRAR